MLRITSTELDFGLYNNCRDSRVLIGREPLTTRVLTMKMMKYVMQRSAIPVMSEKLSKFTVLVKELLIYTTWTLLSFQISTPVYILGAIFEERFETKENEKGKSPERNFTARNVLEARRPQSNTCRRQIKRYQNTQRTRYKKQFKEILPYINY